jgi:hypothetical protein
MTAREPDPEAEGRRAGRELWPAGASWVPDEVQARFAQLAAEHPSLDTDAARTAFLNAARDARKSAPTAAESQRRAELLARLRAGNAARTAAARANRATDDPLDPEAQAEAAAIARRRRESLERRRGK